VRYRSIDASGQLVLGRAVIALPSYSVNSAALVSAELGSYIQVAAGVTWTAQRGRVTLFANNLFNTDTGLFATREFVQPQALRGGGFYVPVPLLLPPRAYTLLYRVRAGRTK
jgi:hypothetical protein